MQPVGARPCRVIPPSGATPAPIRQFHQILRPLPPAPGALELGAARAELQSKPPRPRAQMEVTRADGVPTTSYGILLDTMGPHRFWKFPLRMALSDEEEVAGYKASARGFWSAAPGFVIHDRNAPLRRRAARARGERAGFPAGGSRQILPIAPPRPASAPPSPRSQISLSEMCGGGAALLEGSFVLPSACRPWTWGCYSVDDGGQPNGTGPGSVWNDIMYVRETVPLHVLVCNGGVVTSSLLALLPELQARWARPGDRAARGGARAALSRINGGGAAAGGAERGRGRRVPPFNPPAEWQRGARRWTSPWARRCRNPCSLLFSTCTWRRW